MDKKTFRDESFYKLSKNLYAKQAENNGKQACS